MQHPRPRSRARGGADTGVSFGDDAPVSSKSRAPIQAIPECEAEALAYGEALPTGSQLAEVRTLWWSQRSAGVRLPVEPSILLIAGGRP